MQNITLFVLAAGMGSRYGGLKQMEGFGPNKETLIDYSIYDAINSGFNKIVFVIRKDMEEAFKEIFMTKYEGKINISYVFQDITNLPDWYTLDPQRTKPWGTGHALLCAKDAIQEPFGIINGDDFYGRESFEILAKFLQEECTPDTYCIPAYRLSNVLSDHGTVKRGVCTVQDGYLKDIQETFELERKEDSTIQGTTWDGKDLSLTEDTPISMNMFGIHHSIFNTLEKRFEEFLKNNTDPLKGEFLLPVILSDMINKKEVNMKVYETPSQWFGVTYPEDGPIVREKLKELVEKSVYPSNLNI